MIFKKCFSTIIVVEGVLTVSSNELQEAVLPWCRKGGVMVSVGDLRDEDGWWNSANNSGLVGVGKKFLLWGGKGNDKDLLAYGGSLMLGDVWTATTRIDKTFLGNGADVTTWNQVLLDPTSSPDARWKSGGDVFHGYFLSFGGDDFLDFMNDLWVLPLAPAIGIENNDDSSSSRKTLKVNSMTKTTTPSINTSILLQRRLCRGVSPCSTQLRSCHRTGGGILLRLCQEAANWWLLAVGNGTEDALMMHGSYRCLRETSQCLIVLLTVSVGTSLHGLKFLVSLGFAVGAMLLPWSQTLLLVRKALQFSEDESTLAVARFVCR